jgi:membrane protease YdiL (CAAX protease family)
MRSYVAFMVTLLVLLLVTRLVTGRGRVLAPRVPFANPRREALLALIPAALLFVLASAIFLAAARSDRGSASPTDDRADTAAYTSTRAAGQLAANSIAVFPVIVMLVARRQGLATVGISRHNLVPALLIGAVACVAAVVINSKATGAFWLHEDTLWRIVAQLGVGVSEEVIFRGYLQLRWAAWLSGSGWIAVAAICTVWHVPAALASGGVDIAAVGANLSTVLAAALTFGLCMKLTGNIAGLAVVHAALNMVSDV